MEYYSAVKRKKPTNIPNNLDESQNNYAEQKKKVRTRKYIAYDSIYKELLKMQTDLQGEKAHQHCWEWGGREGWEGRITKGPEETFVGDAYIYYVDFNMVS